MLQQTARLIALKARTRLLLKQRWGKHNFVFNTKTGRAWNPGQYDKGSRLDALRAWLKKNPVEDCKVCALGAIYLAGALDKTATIDDVYAIRKKAIDAARERYAVSLTSYNDSNESTLQGVLSLFK